MAWQTDNTTSYDFVTTDVQKESGENKARKVKRADMVEDKVISLGNQGELAKKKNRRMESLEDERL